MANPHGRFVWHELVTTDTGGAKSFYGSVVGWAAQDMPMPGMTYTMLMAAETPVAGLMALPEDAKKMNAPPSWIGYIGVDDVDTTVDRIQRLGGSVYVPPRDIPNVGRFAVVTDPQKAAFALFKPQGEPQQNPAAEMGTPGHAGWNELYAADWEKAFAFYGQLFGWKKGEAHDMGPMGTYQLFSAGSQPIGGMFNKPAAVPSPFWLYYFNVSGVGAAADRVKANGGQVINGPMEVPGGSWIVQGKDPQGAMFALVGAR
jgi:uncharacterized protein